MGTRGCIDYNPVLSIRQLGYPMRGAPSKESITPFIARGFSDPNARIFQRVRKAWSVAQRKDKELRGSNNGIIGGYHKWLKAWMQELDWLPKLRTSSEEEAETPEESEEVQALKAELEKAQAVKEKFKMIAIKVWKECDELRDINMATAEALDRETKRARKEEWGQNKFRGALWGSNIELKLQRVERDQSRV